MAIKAGQKITAAHLSHTVKSVALANTDPTLANTWTDWGTEVITIPNPGIAVDVTGIVTGNGTNDVDTSTIFRSRVAISMDGGTTYDVTGWFTGHRVGTSVGNQDAGAASHNRSGVPTGAIKVKAQFEGTDTDVKARNGTLTVIVMSS